MAKDVVRFTNGLSRDLRAITEPWSIDRIDAHSLAVRALAASVGMGGNGRQFPEQLYVSVTFTAPGRNLLEPSLAAYRKDSTISRKHVPDYASVADGYERYRIGNDVVLLSRDRVVVARCPSEIARESLPNPYCIALIYPEDLRVLVVVGFPAHSIKKLPVLIQQIERLSEQTAEQ